MPPEPTHGIICEELIQFLSTNLMGWDTPSSTAKDLSIIETHGATVLLGKVHALKIKKPVTFDHMDYSTLDNRKAFVEKEMRINRRTAPDLYIDTISPCQVIYRG